MLPQAPLAPSHNTLNCKLSALSKSKSKNKSTSKNKDQIKNNSDNKNSKQDEFWMERKTALFLTWL